MNYFGIESDKDCIYCNEGDSIRHTFIDCRFAKFFLDNIIEWFNGEHTTSFSLSIEERLFGILNYSQFACSDRTVKKLNYCLVAKYYLYCQKLNKKQLNFDESKQRIAFKFRLAKVALFFFLFFSVLQIPTCSSSALSIETTRSYVFA